MSTIPVDLKCRTYAQPKANQGTYETHNLLTGEITQCSFFDLSFLGIDNVGLCYVRQSTTDQCSLDEQVAKCKQVSFNNHSLKYLVVFRYMGSGWNTSKIKNNSSLNRMLRLVTCKISEKVFIYDVSRFMRRSTSATEILSTIFNPNNSSLISCTESRIWDNDEENQIEFNRSLITAQEQSCKLSKRVKDKFQSLKTNGHSLGSPRFGLMAYKDINGIRKFKLNPVELKFLGYIKYYRGQGFNYANVSTILNNEGFMKRNKPWTKAGVISAIFRNRDVYNNPAFTGEAIIQPYQHMVVDMGEALEEIVQDEENVRENWINCERCGKWRHLEEEGFNDFKDLPNFQCSDVFGLRCAIPQEPLPDGFHDD